MPRFRVTRRALSLLGPEVGTRVSILGVLKDAVRVVLPVGVVTVFGVASIITLRRRD